MKRFNLISLFATLFLGCFVFIYACTKEETRPEPVSISLGARNNSGPQQSNHQDSFKYVPVVYGFDLNVLLEDTTPFNGAYLTKLRRETQRVAPLRYQLGRFDIDVADTTKFLKSDSFIIVRVVKI